MNPWQHQAACLGDPWPFHPDHTTGDAYEAALAICRTCPVVAECLEFALAREGAGGADGRHGVWGGTTPEQRARMVRREQRARAGGLPPPQCGTPNGYKWHRSRGQDACDPCREAHREHAARMREQRRSRAEAAS